MQMVEIAFAAGEQIIDAHHFVALLQQPVAQMRAEKAGAAGHQNALAAIVEFGHLAGFIGWAPLPDPMR